MTRLGGSLRARLFLALALIFVLGAAGMDLLRRAHAQSPEELLEAQGMATEARQLAAALRFAPDGRLQGVDPSPAWRRAYATVGSSAYTVFGPAGQVEARSPNLAASLPRPVPSASLISPIQLTPNGRALTLSIRAARGRVVAIARPNPGGTDTPAPVALDDFAPTLLFGALALLAVLAGWVVAAWSLRPLERAAEELAQVGPNRPDARMSGEGLPSELAPLARGVNTALDRVGEAYAAQARFTADAAHALRTPLTVLDLRLQRAEAGAPLDWPVVRADLAQLRQVVAALLALTRAERVEPQRMAAEVNLARLAREGAAAMAPAADACGRRVEVEASAKPLMVRGDPIELRDLIGALIDNALVHGAGRVLVEVAYAGGCVVLRVGDEGEGVPQAQREAVFERFRKLRGASPGAGLGLSIVRRTARNGGGDARLVAPSVVEVRLPAVVSG